MGRRLALLAEGNHQSPWSRTSGSESAVRVKGLGGAKVGMKVELRDGGELLLFFAEGITDLQPFNPREWVRYSVVKLESSVAQMTTVEVLLGDH